MNNGLASAATRMSSGYFSGDDFRSYHSHQMHQPPVNRQCDNYRNKFNVNKFLSGVNQAKKYQCDVIDDFDSMYKRLGLDDDKPYGQVNIHINRELDANKVYELIEDVNYVNNEPTGYAYPHRNVIADCVKDDMATRRIGHDYENVNSLRQRTALNKSAYNLSQDLATASAGNGYESFSSKRQRSNSMSSLNKDDKGNSGLYVSNIVVPSPTTADYLRNRTRENFNVIMNPSKSSGKSIHALPCQDFELSQILYDDMAYRQLRKDSDAYKLSQMKSMTNNYKHVMNTATTPLTNITTLPMSYNGHYNNENSSSYNVKTVKMLKQRDACNKTYRQSFNVNNGMPVMTNR